MRLRWPVLAVTIPLVFCWAVATAFPAAALAQPGGLVQSGGPISHLAPRGAVVPSSNWAGYAATGGHGSFTSVSSSWVQPAGHCGDGSQYAAFWVGLDGYSSGTVEQTGSEVDCVGQTPTYYGWYETYPSMAVDFANPVQPGDHLSGQVTYLGQNKFELTLTDSTQGWTQTVSPTLAGTARSSAEVIAEAPCCTARHGTLPLADFGTVGFSSTTVNNAPLCTLSPVEVGLPATSVSPITICWDFSVSYTGSPASLFPGPSASP